MRRLLHVGLHTFQLQRLHGVGLPLSFLSEPVQQFALLYDHAVQLLDLMLKVHSAAKPQPNTLMRVVLTSLTNMEDGGWRVEASGR